MWDTLPSFYRSKEWEDLRRFVIASRLNDCGETICEHCGKPIYKAYDIILHHITHLTIDNVNDYDISLNPDNLMIVHHNCHNDIHYRFGTYTRHIYLIYGSPLSGKTSYVNSIATKDDLVLDIDKLREAITGGKLYERSNRCNDNVFAIRDALLDMIRYQRGRWINAYVIGTYPYVGERERIARELEAEIILIEATKEECLERLESCDDGRDKQDWNKYIEDWFRLTSPPE